MKVLLFGGSFDPPHRGHLELLRAALKAVRPERTFLLPAWRSPLKEGHAASPADRLVMTRLLASAAGGPTGVVRVDPFELRRGKTTYTFEALRRYRSRLPGAELWFLAGSDAVATLGRWKRAEEVNSSCRWLVGRRPGVPMPPKFKAKLLPGVFPDVSSTLLRARLTAGLDVSMLLPRQVLDFIRRRGLYGGAIHRALERELNPGRYAHTLGVAKLALELAERHRLDVEKAALAGLLHDAGRSLGPKGVAGYARRHRLTIPAKDEVLARGPMLAHAYVSEDLARRRFRVSDPVVLAAIRNHTFGTPGMSALERLLYVADLSSVDRGYPEAARVRRLARKDLDAAFLEAVRVKARVVIDEGGWLHPQTAALWNWAVRRA